MHRVDVPGKPVAKKRPRVLKSGRSYSPTGPDEDRAAFIIKAGLKGISFDKQVVVSMVFYGADARGDIDNYGKTYLDALVKAGVLKDDRYVVGLWLEKKPVDAGGARTEIAVGHA